MNAHVILANPQTAQPCLPPPVGIPRQDKYSAAAEAAEDRHPLAHLMRLRDEAAAEVERLLAFLDATDGLEDLEPSLAGFAGGLHDREFDPAETGIGDLDGLVEQYEFTCR